MSSGNIDASKVKNLSDAVKILSDNFKASEKAANNTDKSFIRLRDRSKSLEGWMNKLSKSVDKVQKGDNRKIGALSRSIKSIGTSSASAHASFSRFARVYKRFVDAASRAPTGHIASAFTGLSVTKLRPALNALEKFSPAINKIAESSGKVSSSRAVRSVETGGFNRRLGHILTTLRAMNREARALAGARLPRTPVSGARGTGAIGGGGTPGGTPVGPDGPVSPGGSGRGDRDPRRSTRALSRLGKRFSNLLGMMTKITAISYFASYLIGNFARRISSLLKPIKLIAQAVGKSTEQYEKQFEVLRSRFGQASSSIISEAIKVGDSLGANVRDVLEEIITITNSQAARQALIDPLGRVDVDKMRDIVRMIQSIKMTQPDIAARFGQMVPNILQGDSRSFSFGFETTPQAAEESYRTALLTKREETENKLAELRESKQTELNKKLIALEEKRLQKIKEKQQNVVTAGEFAQGGESALRFTQQTAELFVDEESFEVLAKQASASFRRIQGAFYVMMADLGSSGPYRLVADRIEVLADMFSKVADSEAMMEAGKALSEYLGGIFARFDGAFTGLFDGIKDDMTFEEKLEILKKNAGETLGEIKAILGDVFTDISNTVLGEEATESILSMVTAVEDLTYFLGIISDVLKPVFSLVMVGLRGIEATLWAIIEGLMQSLFSELPAAMATVISTIKNAKDYVMRGGKTQAEARYEGRGHTSAGIEEVENTINSRRERFLKAGLEEGDEAASKVQTSIGELSKHLTTDEVLALKKQLNAAGSEEEKKDIMYGVQTRLFSMAKAHEEQKGALSVKGVQRTYRKKSKAYSDAYLDSDGSKFRRKRTEEAIDGAVRSVLNFNESAGVNDLVAGTLGVDPDRLKAAGEAVKERGFKDSFLSGEEETARTRQRGKEIYKNRNDPTKQKGIVGAVARAAKGVDEGLKTSRSGAKDPFLIESYEDLQRKAFDMYEKGIGPDANKTMTHMRSLGIPVQQDAALVARASDPVEGKKGSVEFYANVTITRQDTGESRSYRKLVGKTGETEFFKQSGRLYTEPFGDDNSSSNFTVEVVPK